MSYLNYDELNNLSTKPQIGANPNSDLFEPDEYERFKLLTWRDLSSIEFPKQQWLINSLVPHSGLTVLAAPSGEKKTWIALEMARCIALGKDFLDREEFRTEHANVLYINGEMSRSELQRRGKQLGLSEDNHKIFFITQETINLNEDDSIFSLEQIIQNNEIKAVFVDTLRAVSEGLKEEKAEEVRQFFNRFKSLKNQNIATIFLDHCRKPLRFEGKEPKKEQLFASQDKVANAEVLLMLKSESGTDDIFLYQKKNRVGKEIKPLRILMEDQFNNEGVTLTRLSYGGEFEEKTYKLDDAKDLILGALSDEQKTTNELIELAKTEQIGEKNLREALRSLTKKNHITLTGRQGRQNSYQLPKSGEVINLTSTEESDIASLF